jgi:hypothetical protein
MDKYIKTVSSLIGEAYHRVGDADTIVLDSISDPFNDGVVKLAFVLVSAYRHDDFWVVFEYDEDIGRFCRGRALSTDFVWHYYGVKYTPGG